MAEVTINSLVGEDAAVVQVTVDSGSNTWGFTGTSKKHPEDKPDREIGELLALVRALEKASIDLRKHAQYLGKYNQGKYNQTFYPWFKSPEVIEAEGPTVWQ